MCNTSSSLWSKTTVGKYCPGPQQWKWLIYLSAPRRDQRKSKVFVKGKGREKLSIENLLVPGAFQIHTFKIYFFKLKLTFTNLYLHWIKVRNRGKHQTESQGGAALFLLTQSSELAGISPTISLFLPVEYQAQEAVDPGRLLDLGECFAFSDNLGAVLFPNPRLTLQSSGRNSRAADAAAAQS